MVELLYVSNAAPRATPPHGGAESRRLSDLRGS